MNRLPHSFFAVLATLLFWPGVSALQAQTTSFTYQGRLTDTGTPATGNYDLQFKLFDTDTVGTGVQQAETIVRNPVGASAGVFTVTLDFGANVFDGSARYLEIGVRPAGSMTDYMLLVPRQPVTSTPYAIKSLNAAAADVLSSVCVGCITSTHIGSLPADNGNYIQNTTTPQDASFNISGNALVGGNVGLGTANPLSRLHLANASSFGTGLFVEASEGDRAAIYYAADLGMVLDSFRPADLRRLPLLFQPNGGNVGIGTAFPKHHLSILGGPAWTSNQWAGAVDLTNASAIGWAANAGGQRFGIGQSTGGLYFFHTVSDPGTTGSPAIYDMQISDAGNVGIGTAPSAGIKLDVLGGVLFSPGNGGVMQFGSPNAETGMSNIFGPGRADLRFDGATLKLVAGPVGSVPPSTNGIVVNTAGLVGIGTTTPTQGRLQVNGASLNGVYGSSSFKGIWGESSGNLGVGVYGSSSANEGYGLYGISTGGFGFGVYAQGSRYGGYFSGNVHVTGTLSKSGGAFQIDHPLDPANKYLYHSFVESPDMMNIYNGNITTDSDGAATISLPDYFEALNRDFRYQLTVIGQFAQAIVSSEVSHNRFSIKTDKPLVKVSWQVTGIRQDAYANASRIKVEEDKPETERGYYLHPRAFGESEEKSVEWARDPAGMKQRRDDHDRAAREQSIKRD